jgi:hypothetical protein
MKPRLKLTLVTKISYTIIIIIVYLFKLQMGFYAVAEVPQ